MKNPSNPAQPNTKPDINEKPKGQPKGPTEGEGPTGVPGMPPERPPGGWVPPTAGGSGGTSNTGGTGGNIT